MTNSGSKILILNLKEELGLLDLRLLGYYKIKQGVVQQNLSRYYKFESVEKICVQLNNLINTLKREQNTDTGYPWLQSTHG